MFKFNTKIGGLINTPSYITELAFDSRGVVLGATFAQFDSKEGNLNNKIRLYNFKTKKLIKEISNPTAQLNQPQALLLTQKHLIATNRGDKPNSFLIFTIKDSISKPIQIYFTPFKKLKEAHSLALYKNLLVVTYAERWAKKGTIVCYNYDQKKGRIIQEIDFIDECFKTLGDTKGVSFNEEGDKIFVTFTSEPLNIYGKLKWILKKILTLNAIGNRTNKNGIAVFKISPQGKLSKKPEETYLFENYPRLENIHIIKNKCLVTDTINHSVYIYDLNDKNKFSKPKQIITENLNLPHGGKFSPDGNAIAISNFGLKVKSGKFIQWGKYLDKRKDNIAIFKEN